PPVPAFESFATRPVAVPPIVERPVLVSFGPSGMSLPPLFTWPGVIASGWVLGVLRSCWFWLMPLRVRWLGVPTGVVGVSGLGAAVPGVEGPSGTPDRPLPLRPRYVSWM